MIYESPVWRDVFQNFKDTRLFIDTLKSTTAVHSSSSQDTPVELLNSVESIQKFITFHTSNYKLLKCKCIKKDVQERSIEVKRRQHAVLFLSILKSLKVTSSEADDYYETVLLEPCNIIWYFDLLCHLHWHECFVDCAKQLPDDVMLYVCEQIMSVESKQRSFSLYYVIMQSIIWKLFMLENTQIATHEEQSPKFSFPFEFPEVLKEEKSHERLIKLFKVMLEKSATLEKSEQSKLLLHSIKLIFKIILQVKTVEGIFVNDLFSLTASHISNELFNGDENAISSCDVQDSVYREESAGISVEFLLLTIAAYSDELGELISQGSSCSEFPSDLECLLTRTKELIENRFLVKKQLDENQKILALLEAVIQNHYPCSFKAAEIILNQPNILSSPKFIEVLNNNKEVLQRKRNLILLLNAAFSQKENEPLILLLLDVLSKTPKSVYYDFLKFRIENFGSQTQLKHPAFSDQISQFGRKTLDYDEAEKIMLPLLIQSPYEVISIVAAQALDQGKKGMDLIKVLTNVSDLIYSSNANLLTEITLYFTSEDENHVKKLKHVPLVIEAIITNHHENVVDKVMEICILPHLINNERLEVVLNCLNVALQTLEKRENRCLSSHLFKEYLQKCGALLNDCVLSCRSKTKEQIIEGMSLISTLFRRDFVLKYSDVVSLKSDLKDYNPLVLIYMKDFLNYSVYEILENPAVDLNELMWTWSCFCGDQEILQKCLLQPQFSHVELLKVLTAGLPHFTMKEWTQSSLFVRSSCKHLLVSLASSQKPWKLNDSNFWTYATVKCLMDSISPFLKTNSDTSTHACSNFTNTVMNLVDYPDTQPECLLYIFMDLSLLSNMKDFWKTFSSFLIAILKKTYQYSKDETQRQMFKKLFTSVLKHLPESEGKLAILNAV